MHSTTQGNASKVPEMPVEREGSRPQNVFASEAQPAAAKRSWAVSILLVLAGLTPHAHCHAKRNTDRVSYQKDHTWCHTIAFRHRTFCRHTVSERGMLHGPAVSAQSAVDQGSFVQRLAKMRRTRCQALSPPVVSVSISGEQRVDQGSASNTKRLIAFWHGPAPL